MPKTQRPIAFLAAAALLAAGAPELAHAQSIFPPADPAPPISEPATPPRPRPQPDLTLPGGESRTGVPRVPVQPSPFEVVDPAYAEASNYARAEVEGVRRYFNLTGISAAVMIDGQIVWQEGFGFSDLSNGRPVTPDTRFRIGSISKPITALAMATLVEAGRLDLDAPIQTYVPAFPEKDGVITPRLLVGHLSGIRHYRPGEDDTIRPRRYATMDEALGRFKDDALVAPPGSRYSYSTYAYTLLGAAIEQAAGRPFLVYLDQNVLEPLGMEATGADRGDGQIENLTAFYHRDRESRIIPAPPIDTSYKWAGGGLVSTTGDLLRFAREMMDPTLISEELRDQMWTGMTDTQGRSTHYGMGWSLDVDDRGRRVVAHSGAQVGCTAYLLIFPELNAASVVLCNVSRAELGRDLATVIAEPFIQRREQLAGEDSGTTPASREAEPATVGS
jgi:CubicO group peptidase (beta-lactamase class C family)